MMTALCLPSTGSESEALPASGTDTVTIPRELYEQYRKMDTLMEILDVVEANYYEEIDESSLFDGAAAGLLDSLGDPYTFYYTAESFASYMEHQQGNYAGIGIQISTSYGNCSIQCRKTEVVRNGGVFGSPCAGEGERHTGHVS